MSTYEKTYAEGIAYLQRMSLDLYMPTPFGGMTFKPGSFFEDTEKEKVPKPAKIGQGLLSSRFMDRFNISTEVDLNRMVRAVSIILTNFSGPRDQDSPRIHQNRLKAFIAGDQSKCKVEVVQAFFCIEKILNLEGLLSLDDYFDAGFAICAFAGAF
ncbi:MAG: hypothetical protein ACFFED_08410 [Candidatus Thorarchaeota archaeon]